MHPGIKPITESLAFNLQFKLQSDHDLTGLNHDIHDSESEASVSDGHRPNRDSDGRTADSGTVTVTVAGPSGSVLDSKLDSAIHLKSQAAVRLSESQAAA